MDIYRIPLIKILILLTIFTSLSFDYKTNSITENNIIGTYRVEAYPKSDGLAWEVKLRKNGKGHQKSYFDGCTQTELKFIWHIKDDTMTFTQTLTRERFSCEEKWSDWNNEFFNDEDPFKIKMLSSHEFILSSQLEEYQEKWTKIE